MKSKVIVHFISLNGFEACLEKNKEGQYRAGWKSKPESKFTFLRCSFKHNGNSNLIKESRKNEWTTFSAASKEYNKMIITHKKINFK